MKILTLQLWALRSSKHSMVVLVLLLHYLPYMVVVGGRPNSNSNFTTRGTETSDPVPVPFLFFFSRIFVRVTTVITALFCCLLFFFSWFWGFLVLLAFEQASSTLVPPPNPTICISHYTLHITHHTSHIMSSGSREQANKQAIHCITNPNSPGQKRGEEMRGERVCD